MDSLYQDLFTERPCEKLIPLPVFVTLLAWLSLSLLLALPISTLLHDASRQHPSHLAPPR